MDFFVITEFVPLDKPFIGVVDSQFAIYTKHIPKLSRTLTTSK